MLWHPQPGGRDNGLTASAHDAILRADAPSAPEASVDGCTATGAVPVGRIFISYRRVENCRAGWMAHGLLTVFGVGRMLGGARRLGLLLAWARGRALGVLSATGVMLGLGALALPSLASAFVYVARDDGIHRVSLVGVPRLGPPLISARDLGHKKDVATGLAVDAHHIYWFDPGFNAIGRATLTGRHIQRRFIRSGPNVDAIAVNAAHIYWSTNTGIGRADLNGANVNPLFIAVGRDPLSLASSLTVDSRYVYFPAGGSIGRANLDGTDVNTQAFATTNDVSSVAVRSHSIYIAGWDGVDGICGYLAIQPADGSPQTGPGLGGCADFVPLDIAVGANRVYYLDASMGYALFGANLDLSHRQKLLRGPNLAIATPH